MRKNNDNLTKNTVVSLICVLLLSLASVAMVVVFETTTNARYGVLLRSFNKGDIAEEDVNVISSVDIVDEESTQQARMNAKKSVYPVFTFNSKTTISVLQQFDEYRQNLESNNYARALRRTNKEVIDKIEQMNSFEIIGIAYDVLKDILTNGFYDYYEIQSMVEKGYSNITVVNNYLDDIPFDGEMTLKTDNLVTNVDLDSHVTDAISYLGLNSDEVYIVKYLVGTFAKTNVEYDQYVTESRRNEAYNSVDNIVVSLKKGDPIILKDHVIRQENLDLLQLLSHYSPVRVDSVISDLIYYVITINSVFIMLSFFSINKKHYLWMIETETLFSVLSCVACIGYVHLCNFLGVDFEYSLAPVAFVPVLAVLMTGKRHVGFEYSLMISIMFSRLPGVKVTTFFYFLFIAMVCCVCVRMANKRIDMILAWLVSVVACLMITFIFIIISKNIYSRLLTLLLGISFNITVTYLLMAIIVPVLERILNLPTNYRLHELAFTDSSLLSRLQIIAPGTYTHSCAVADLAEEGAKAIGANSLICRVGGLYHDIGKMEHPEYFVENQTGNNKHDEINPSLSASIIKNHVKVGAQKGKDAGLPDEIINIIESHHGNDVISYFYNEAQKESKANQEVEESDFTYDAEIPMTKECGIVMLADSVEAASRTITPNPQKYNKLIQNIFQKKFANSQLDNCGLTTGDLKDLRNTFVKVLLAKNHSRIEYPDQEEV